MAKETKLVLISKDKKELVTISVPENEVYQYENFMEEHVKVSYYDCAHVITALLRSYPDSHVELRTVTTMDMDKWNELNKPEEE